MASSRDVSLSLVGEEEGRVIIEGDVWRRVVKVLENIDTEETRVLLRDLLK